MHNAVMDVFLRKSGSCILGIPVGVALDVEVNKFFKILDLSLELWSSRQLFKEECVGLKVLIFEPFGVLDDLLDLELLIADFFSLST